MTNSIQYICIVYYTINSPFLGASVHHLVQKSLQVVCGTEMCEIHSEQPLIDLDPIPPVMIRYTCIISGSFQS